MQSDPNALNQNFPELLISSTSSTEAVTNHARAPQPYLNMLNYSGTNSALF